MFGVTQSGRIYRNKGSKKLESNPLVSPLREREEELVRVSPRSAISMIRQRIPHIPPPPTPPLVSPSLTPSPPTPPLPQPQFNMVSAIKFSVFKGVGNEDLDQFWFVVKVVWEAQGVTYDSIKKAMLVSMLRIMH